MAAGISGFEPLDKAIPAGTRFDLPACHWCRLGESAQADRTNGRHPLIAQAGCRVDGREGCEVSHVFCLSLQCSRGMYRFGCIISNETSPKAMSYKQSVAVNVADTGPKRLLESEFFVTGALVSVVVFYVI